MTEEHPMRMRAVFLMILALGLSACAGAGTGGTTMLGSTPYPPEVYQHRVSTNEVEIYWTCTAPGAGTQRVEGVVRNSKGGVVKFMELELDAVDAQGRYGASAKTALPVIQLFANQIAPFALELSAGAEVQRLDLFYNYDRDAAPGDALQVRFMARDVCSPTQHRVRQQG
jgi:ABC-type glycerol-3-phosphate transport system substrate-binding protein